MKTPKKKTVKKSAPAAKNKSGLNSNQEIDGQAFLSDDDDDFDLPMNDLDLDGLDPLDEDDEY